MSLPVLLRAALRRRSGASEVRRSESAWRMAEVDMAQLAAYRAVLDFPQGAVPVTFYYLIAQRAHVAAMADPAFPFRLAGMIHAENALEELSPPAPGRALQVRNVLAIEPPRENGARYCVFETLGEQDGRPVFRCTSRYLAVRGARRARSGPAQDAPEGAHGAGAGASDDAGAGAIIGTWTLGRAAGRRYAKASGDWNPIHLWPWSARIMGLKQPIIHGMHTVGKACALLEQASGRRVQAIQARFAAAIPLGSEVRLEADWQQGRYQVLAGGRLAVEGSFVVL